MLNAALWICQIFLAIVFAYSGAMKSTQSAEKLVAIGQTGVEDLPQSLIRFIGISEIFGVVGIILPWLTGILPVLTPTAAIGFGIIMILAAVVHFKRDEMTSVGLNLFLLLLCAFVAYARFDSLKQ